MNSCRLSVEFLRKFMGRITKVLLVSSGGLCVVGALIFAFLFWKHDVIGVEFPFLYLILLYVLLFSYAGALIFLAGLFIWSLTAESILRIVVWVIIGLLIILFIPIASVDCTGGDVVYCHEVFVFQARYWEAAWNYLIYGNRSEVFRWNSFGAELVFNEGFGDLVQEIKKVQGIVF